MTEPTTTPGTHTNSAPAQTPAHGPGHTQRNPWPALWALVIGFFMILVDTTIVSVANPAIKAALDPSTNNLDNVVWVTSAYLLAYAVPLLITGRLGDRFGPKRVYLVGLAIFTLASLACGLSGTLEMLIVFRAAQGLGASLMTPQTMAVITRTFPPTQRGAAMGLWGATSGVAMLVGPLAGGLLVDAFGWEWIFFINLPVGVIGFVLAWMLVPDLETHEHRFDILGVFLSAIALFLIVFGLQEGEHYDWAAWPTPLFLPRKRPALRLGHAAATPLRHCHDYSKKPRLAMVLRGGRFYLPCQAGAVGNGRRQAWLKSRLFHRRFGNPMKKPS